MAGNVAHAGEDCLPHVIEALSSIPSASQTGLAGMFL